MPRKWFASFRPPAQRPSFRPMLEPLEDRLTPTVYSLTDLGTLGGATGSSGGQTLNASGQVVGYSLTSSGADHAFLYGNGALTDLGTLSGYTDSAALALNTSGQVVGEVFNSPDAGGTNEHAFLYSAGQMTDLNGLASSSVSGQLLAAYAINDNEQIAGDLLTPGGAIHAFVYDKGTVTDLGTLGPAGSFATAINNAGLVVGYYDTTTATNSGAEHAFVYTAGHMTDLGTLGGGDSVATDVNGSGQIVGYATTASGAVHAFLDAGGQMTDLGTLAGFSASTATAINDAGEIVGAAARSDSGNVVSDAFVYSDGTMTDLNSLLPSGTGVTLTDAQAINDNGQIVAKASNGHVYLLTPQQAPTVTITGGVAAPAALTAGASGQAVTVSAVVGSNGPLAATGAVVFALVGTNGTVAGDGPAGVSLGADGNASDTLTVPAATEAGTYSLQVTYTGGDQTVTQSFGQALTINPLPNPVPAPTPTPAPVPPPIPPQQQPSPPSLFQALYAIYFDGIELALDTLTHKDTSAAQANLDANLPDAGPFGQMVEYLGIEAVFNAI